MFLIKPKAYESYIFYHGPLSNTHTHNYMEQLLNSSCHHPHINSFQTNMNKSLATGLAHGFSANLRVWAHLPAANGPTSPSIPVNGMFVANKPATKRFTPSLTGLYINMCNENMFLDRPGATGLDQHYPLDTCGVSQDVGDLHGRSS